MTVCCDSFTLRHVLKDGGYDASFLLLCCLFSDAVSIPVHTDVVRFDYIMAVNLMFFIDYNVTSYNLVDTCRMFGP